MQTAPDSIDSLSAMLAELMLPDDVAELRLLTELCRRSLAVRSWLFARFATERSTRAAFRSFVSNRAPADHTGRIWSRHLAEMVAAAPRQPGREAGPHGGLSRSRILTLIVRYQYERMDAKTFFLVRLWLRCKALDGGRIPVGLWRETLSHWEAMIADPDGRLMRDAMHAVQFFNERADRPIGETDFGYVNSWKIHVLLYILDFPKPRYHVAELRAGLPQKYRQVDRKLIRRLCQLHGIRRDTNPGERPGSLRRLLPR